MCMDDIINFLKVPKEFYLSLKPFSKEDIQIGSTSPNSALFSMPKMIFQN